MQFLKNHRLLIGLLTLLIIIALSLIFLTRPKPTPPALPIPSPSPLPTLGVVSANPSQRLTINWNNISLTPPEKLPLFTVIAPLINNDLITTITTTLGFTAADSKTTLKETSKLFVKNNRSLFASTAQNQIQYNVTGNFPTQTGFANLSSLTEKNNSYLRQFFPKQNFTPLGQTEFFYTTNSTETYPQKVNQAKANLARFAYLQIVNGYPLLTTAGRNAIISFTFDSSATLRSLEISGGFQNSEAGPEVNLRTYSDLRQNAADLAVPLSLEATVDTKSIIDSQSAVTLDLTNLELVYFAKPESSQILPAFLLTGTLKGNFPDTPAVYLVPATSL